MLERKVTRARDLARRRRVEITLDEHGSAFGLLAERRDEALVLREPAMLPSRLRRSEDELAYLLVEHVRVPVAELAGRVGKR